MPNRKLNKKVLNIQSNFMVSISLQKSFIFEYPSSFFLSNCYWWCKPRSGKIKLPSKLLIEWMIGAFMAPEKSTSGKMVRDESLDFTVFKLLLKLIFQIKYLPLKSDFLNLFDYFNKILQANQEWHWSPVMKRLLVRYLIEFLSINSRPLTFSDWYRSCE